MGIRLAAIITCHNRRLKTLDSLESLFAQELPPDSRLDVYLYDDGSSDGTRESVLYRYPDINVMVGDGSAFWNGGMRHAFGRAMISEYDFYLWLNDDTRLSATALASMLHTHEHLNLVEGRDGIVVGATCDPATGQLTYGGFRVNPGGRGFGLELLPESTLEPQRCDTVNGNCVLISNRAATELGNLDPSFTHSMGDLDYGFRATELGVPIWVAPGFVGECSRNSDKGTWRDTSLAFRTRWSKLLGPKGLPPREWLRFCARHGGKWWPLLFASPYLRLVFGLSSRSDQRHS